MKVKAAVAHEAGAPFGIETVDLEGPHAGEVLVQQEATGICHTDAYTLELEAINRGFELMHKGESIRSVAVY